MLEVVLFLHIEMIDCNAARDDDGCGPLQTKFAEICPAGRWGTCPYVSCVNPQVRVVR
jgi:hypothetical protein